MTKNQITIGKNVQIGKNLPVIIQTMWKDKLLQSDIEGDACKRNILRIENLSALGCSILRFAVPNIESAEILGKLASMVSMPIVADIHFDYKIALRCLDFPIAKIRINPGNIGTKDRVKKVLDKCGEKNVPIRIGVNLGSLNSDLRTMIDENKISTTDALVEAAQRELSIFDEFNFDNVVVSIKASSALETVIANEKFSQNNNVPLHIGVTEAGPLIAGVVRNTAALYKLLCNNIGNTVRVSLSDTMENEVIAAREILLAVDDAKGVRTGGVRIISCPRCGRCSFDTHKFTEKWKNELYKLKKNIDVAIMGCVVNGPGEARNADLGITGADDKVILFKGSKIVRRITLQEADNAFKEELNNIHT